MNRFLQTFNLLGVLALAALSTVQWQSNGKLNQQNISLETTVHNQEQIIATDKQTISGYAADLDEFRQRLTLSETKLKRTVTALHDAEDQRDRLDAMCRQLTKQVDAIKSSLDVWKAAVAQRDAALKETIAEATKLAAQRDLAVGKFNELAGKYNGVVKELDQSRGAATEPTSQPASFK